MSIEAIRELGTLASVCPELNMANYTEDDVRHLNDWAIEMSLLVEKFAAIQQAEAQQPSSKEHLFELWWEAHMPNATQEQAWTAFTAAVASNGVGIAAQQPVTGEPVAQWQKRHPVRTGGRWISTDEHDAKWWSERATGWEARALYTRPAPSVPADVARDAERWRTFLATRPSNTHEVVNDAIDAAMLAASS